MTTGITVDVEPLCERPLQLFVSGHNAWGHLRDHALGMQESGEEQGWGLLLPGLMAQLSAGNLEALRELARAVSVDAIPARLNPIYREFLRCIQQAVEGAVRVNWYWEEVAPAESRWSVFGKEGIFAHLDDDYVRTGYLPEKNPDAWSDPSVGSPPFRLFLACLLRVQVKYRTNLSRRRIESIHDDFDNLLNTGIDEKLWGAMG
jgi:hypothetical protein